MNELIENFLVDSSYYINKSFSVWYPMLVHPLVKMQGCVLDVLTRISQVTIQ